MALRGGGDQTRELGTDAVAGDQQLGHRVGGRLAQRHHPAPRADRKRNVVGVIRWRAKQKDRAGWRLLDGLEQRVSRLLREPVGVFHDEHLPAAVDRRAGRAHHQLAHLGHRNAQPVGHHEPHIGVAAGQGRMAARALPTADRCGRALQGRGKGARGHRTAGPGRPSEQPGVRHAQP
jgi:hypothetical protein